MVPKALLDSTVRVRTSSRTGPAFIQLTNSQPISWYACGPTVYDVSHLGHARNYVSTDIMRRILSNHFGFDLSFAMGMTDVDDKIINKGLQAKCATMMDFILLANRYELEFFQDMDRLQVLRPHATLRVTEHIPEIIAFIQTLLDKGHAYQSKDGVYFKVSSIPADRVYDRFGCLGSEGADNEETLQSTAGHDKQDAKDFALWKCAPSDTAMAWSSPFGFGRPGWHIECSAMTFAHFGSKLDIHSGGIDLKFPHHTNEIAQSECHCSGRGDWVELWLHTGHLHIDGRKMSKSLKNFISIEDYFASKLTSSPSVDFRLYCLQHRYSTLLTYSADHILKAEAFRQRIAEQFLTIKVLRAATEVVDKRYSRKPTASSKLLEGMLSKTRADVSIALADDFDTPTALQCVQILINEANKYLDKVKQDVFARISGTCGEEVQPLEPLLAIEEYIRRLFSHSFGVELCMPISEVASSERDVDGFVSASVDFRTKIRTLAVDGLKAQKALKADKNLQMEVLFKQLLQECDGARNAMQVAGVQVDDLNHGLTKWKWKE